MKPAKVRTAVEDEDLDPFVGKMAEADGGGRQRGRRGQVKWRGTGCVLKSVG